MGRKDPNLLHGTRRVLVEDVTKRHKTVCSECAQMPAERRLLVVAGSGLSQTRTVLCIPCGAFFLHGFMAEVERAVIRLRTGEGEIRL